MQMIEQLEDAEAWSPVIHHKDYREHFQKKIIKWWEHHMEDIDSRTDTERYEYIVEGIRRIAIPYARKSRKRLQKSRSSYKHGWSELYIGWKLKFTSLLRIRDILHAGGAMGKSDEEDNSDSQRLGGADKERELCSRRGTTAVGGK